MEDASADVASELLDALLSGTNSKRLEELASTWSHAQTPKLLAAVCGLRFPPVPKEDESTALALQVALAKLLDSAVKPGAQGPSPLLGTLQTLPPQGARQVMTRISKLYGLIVGMMVSAESKCLSDPLLQLLVQLQLISGTPLRSLRQAASAAALGALQALLAERQVARGALAELETQKRGLMDAAGDAAAAARLARLCRGTVQLETVTQQMDVEVGKLQERVLLPRLQDTAAILRRFTLNALGRYMQMKFLWTPERILQGFFDPAPEVRLEAIEIAGAWFEGDLDHDLALVREAAHHLAERSRDSEPRVSAAALRHLRHPVLVSQLSDDDFARVANLALTAPDSHGLLRVEAALFVEQHLLPEPGLGIAAKKQPGEEGDDLERHFITEHGLMAVADFLTSYLPENQLHLSRRFVEALWLRCDVFRRWSALADLCLLGEGQGAARGVPCLPNRQRLALLVVLDAALKCAEVPSDATEALLPRLPRLFELFTAEGLCFLDVLASISRRLICAACQKDSEAPLPRALLTALLSALRGGVGVAAQLQLADALVAWAERSSEVKSATGQLVLDLYSSVSLQLSSPTSDLSQVLGPLLALGQRGVDLWTCDKIGLGNKIFGSALSILEASDGQPKGETMSVSPRVAAELLQLLTLLSCWRARCFLGEALKENSGFLMWCHLIRASCSKVMAGEANDLLLRLEAFSCYLLLLHLEFLGHKDTQGLPKVPELHLTSIDLALRDFYAGASKSSAWRQSAAQLGGREVTICRWLIDRYLREAKADEATPESWEEVKSMVASCASRMLAECQHEAIYTSSAAERLLQHLGHLESVELAKSGSDSQVAALQLLSRLRRYGGRCAHEASQGYQMQFRAAARHAKENGLEAGLQLAKTLIHWSAPPIIAGSRAATHLGRGMTVALKACCAEKMGLDLEVLVPWLRDAGCPLPGPAAQKLATQLAEDFGLLGQSITAHPQKRPRPWRLTAPAGVWPLVTALQAIGSRIPRSNSWQAKLQETAKRRLAKRRPASLLNTPRPPTATSAWLAPLEKKSPEAPDKVKRRRDENPRSNAPLVPHAPEAAPAKRKWQLKDY